MEWFQRTIQSKQDEIVVIDPFHAETAGWNMVTGFNIPITDEGGNEIIGVLTTRVSMDFIIQRIQTLAERTLGNNHACLLNRKGDILAGPDKSKFLTTYRLFEYPVVKDLLAGKTGISEYKNDRGENVISARYVLQGDGDFDGWGWGIIVTEPVSEAFKAAYIIRNTMVILILTLTLLVAVIAAYFSRKLTRPIIQVSKSALKITGGDLKPIEIKYKQKDEIGQLVGSFNKMSGNLYTTTVSRDALVKEIAERKKVEEVLKERVKELQCLYSIAEISERQGITLDELYQEAAYLLPPSWQYPEITCSRIIIKDKSYESDNFRKTKWIQKANISIKTQVIGTVEVYYLEKKPDIYEGPFLKEERYLINAVAKQLGEYTGRIKSEKSIKKLNADLKMTIKELNRSNQELEQFAYISSHDLQEPLRKVLVFGEQLTHLNFVCINYR